MIQEPNDTTFGAGTFSWQDPVHSWKAGPGEVMTVENKQTITDHHIGSEYSPLRTLLTLAFGKQVSLQFISFSARVLAMFAIELIHSLCTCICFFRLPARMQE